MSAPEPALQQEPSRCPGIGGSPGPELYVFPAKSEVVVETDARYVEVGAAVAGVERRKRGGGGVSVADQRRFCHRVAAEIHIKIFGLQGQVVQQGVFEPGARGPAGVQTVRR